MTPSILGKGTALDLSPNRPMQPKAISALEEDDGITVHANRSRSLKRNPAKRFLAAPTRAPLVSIARDRELLTNRLHGIGMQSECPRGPVGETYQVETRGPAFVPLACSLLRFPAEVPDEIDRARLRFQCLCGTGSNLEAIAVSQNHANILPQERRFLSGLKAGVSAPDIR